MNSLKTIFIGCLLACMSSTAWAKPPPAATLRELVLRTRGSKGMAGIHKAVQAAIPKGWDGARDPSGHYIELRGPKGEGKLLFAAALHPSQLDRYLSRLKKEHPAAAPSPPQPMELKGVVSKILGERATRFVITGREVGEMILIEKRDTIVLLVTVVSPETWPEVKPLMERMYRTVQVFDRASK